MPASSRSRRKPAAAAASRAANAPASKPGKTVTQTGTGFVISSNGHVVTNQHVIDGCGDISGNLSGEAPVKLRLVSSDETNDLALLQAPSPFKEVASIRENAVQLGDGVVAIGYPYHGLLTSDFTVTTGIVSSLSGIFNDTRHLQISAAVQPGNSGGPLLDFGGAVVGVVAAKLDAIEGRARHRQSPREHQFRHQDRRAAGFSRQQRGDVPGHRAARRKGTWRRPRSPRMREASRC